MKCWSSHVGQQYNIWGKEIKWNECYEYLCFLLSGIFLSDRIEMEPQTRANEHTKLRVDCGLSPVRPKNLEILDKILEITDGITL
jgi:hypothetical protein